MSNDLITFDDIDTSLIQVSNLPEVIENQVELINKLDEKVSKAFGLAEDAKKASGAAAGKKSGLGHKKEAIESIQEAVKQIGEATAENADSQKLMFDYMQKLAQITKNMLSIGCSSIAMNRATVRELELKLNGASKEKLSDLAKKELLKVVTQLKQQEDIMSKQEKLTEVVHSQSKEIERVSGLTQRHLNILKEKEKIDIEQTQRLKELGEIILNKEKIDQTQELDIQRNTIAIKKLFEYIEQKREIDNIQQIEINDLKKTRINVWKPIIVVSIVLSTLSLAFSIFVIVN